MGEPALRVVVVRGPAGPRAGSRASRAAGRLRVRAVLVAPAEPVLAQGLGLGVAALGDRGGPPVGGAAGAGRRLPPRARVRGDARVAPRGAAGDGPGARTDRPPLPGRSR